MNDVFSSSNDKLDIDDLSLSFNTKRHACKENERARVRIEHVRQAQDENEMMQSQLEQDRGEMQIENKSIQIQVEERRMLGATCHSELMLKFDQGAGCFLS